MKESEILNNEREGNSAGGNEIRIYDIRSTGLT